MGHEFVGMDSNSICHPIIAHLRSRQEIVLFGRDNHESDFMGDWEAVNLRVFSLETQKWRKIDGISLYKMSCINHTLVDDKYIIFSATLRTSRWENDSHSKMFVLEIG